MTPKELIKASKLLSLVLRHKPDHIGIKLDSNGWTDVRLLLKQLKAHGHHITKDNLIQIVDTNDKKRFALNDNQTEIRASQGHSVNIDLDLIPQTPPQLLYHGTARQFVGSIFKEGIKKGKRTHVHLSHDIPTALKVGSRHGDVVLLQIDASKLDADGYTFYLSANGVWLIEFIPAGYFILIEHI